MANKYHVYCEGKLDATFSNEREAFFRMKDLQWQFKKGLNIIIEGDERFKIIEENYSDGLSYHIVDVRTGTQNYGVCASMADAIEHKKWCEKHHLEGGKYMDDYYKQYI